MSDKLTQADLAKFTGTGIWYRHWLRRSITYTEGVKYVADKAGAYWLIDAIVSHQLNPLVRAEEFQLWKLVVRGESATLICEDGNGNEVTRQEIEYTDFPLPEISLYLTDNVILLPGEY